MEVRALEDRDRRWAADLLAAHMGSPRVALRGKLYDALTQPGIVALRDGSPAGLVTYLRCAGHLEILTLHAAERGLGVGSRLIDAVAAAAREEGLGSIRVTTTNDNLDGLRFYQRRGFRLATLRAGEVERSRMHLKPEIPATGSHGIPIRDEIELQMDLP